MEVVFSNFGLYHISEKIVHHLDPKSLHYLSLVSRSFTIFLKNPKIWWGKFQSHLISTIDKGPRQLTIDTPDYIELWKALIKRTFDDPVLQECLATAMKLKLNSENFEVLKESMETLRSYPRLDAKTPLALSVVFNQVPLAKFILEDTNFMNLPVISNLLELVFLNNGSAKLIKYLIFKIKKYFLPETFGESFLHLAAYHGNIEIFEMLLQIGLNPKKTSEKINSKLKMQNLHHSLTPIHIAIMRGNTEIVERLITIHTSEEIQKLILTAIEHDHPEIVKVLYQFEKLPRKNVSFKTIGSLLNSDTFCERWCYHAAILGKVDTLQMLISLGDLPKNSEAIQKLILRTIEFDQPEIVKMLYPFEKVPTSFNYLSTMECFLNLDKCTVRYFITAETQLARRSARL